MRHGWFVQDGEVDITDIKQFLGFPLFFIFLCVFFVLVLVYEPYKGDDRFKF